MTREGERFGDLALKVQRLEDIERIRALKARYLNACDQKMPDDVRGCFLDGEVLIDAGHLVVFKSVDYFVAMYSRLALHEHILDKHQCGNGEIAIIDAAKATGLRCLDFRAIDTKSRTITMMSLLYHDKYQKVSEQWKISESRAEHRTIFQAEYGDNIFNPVLAGIEPMLSSSRLQALDA